MDCAKDPGYPALENQLFAKKVEAKSWFFNSERIIC